MLKKLSGEPLHLDWRISVLTVVSTLLLIVDSYYSFTPWKWLDRFILYFIIPMIIILVVFREKPGEYGFCLGDWRAGLVITLGAVVLIAPILWLVNHYSHSMQGYYNWQTAELASTIPELFAWEYIFRGWLLFGYARRFGGNALWLQAVPFALAHIGKPDVETISTIFGGFAFGWVAWRTRSFLYPFLIHYFVYSFTVLLAAGLL